PLVGKVIFFPGPTDAPLFPGVPTKSIEPLNGGAVARSELLAVKALPSIGQIGPPLFRNVFRQKLPLFTQILIGSPYQLNKNDFDVSMCNLSPQADDPRPCI